MAKRVSSEDFEAEVLGSDLPVVVEFYSDKFDGKKVTNTKGKVLTDAQGGGQAGPCANK